MLIQLPLCYKLGFRFRWSWQVRHVAVQKMFALVPPRFLTLAMSELENLALTFFATSIGHLSFVIMNLALRLMTIPIRMFGVPISQASLPFLSEVAENERDERFINLILQSLNQIAFFALPASMLLLILRIPIVRLVFGTENFPWRTTVTTAMVVAIISLSITAQAMVQLFIRVFHALKDTVTPLMVAIAQVSLYLALNALFVFYFKLDVMGLAIATTVSAFFEVILFAILLHKRIGLCRWQGFFLPQIKMLLSSFLMAVFLYLPFRILDELVFNTTRTLELISLTVVTSTIGLLVYLYFSYLLEVKELSYFGKMLTTFGPWRKSLAKSEEVLVDTGSDNAEV